MIFTFIDDSTLSVLENIEEVRRDCEGIDVENGVYKFFDENGYSLEAVFTKPNKKTKILGLVWSVESGIYELKASDDGKDLNIMEAIGKTVALNENKFFKTLEEVKLFLTSAST